MKKHRDFSIARKLWHACDSTGEGRLVRFVGEIPWPTESASHDNRESGEIRSNPEKEEKKSLTQPRRPRSGKRQRREAERQEKMETDIRLGELEKRMGDVELKTSKPDGLFERFDLPVEANIKRLIEASVAAKKHRETGANAETPMGGGTALIHLQEQYRLMPKKAREAFSRRIEGEFRAIGESYVAEEDGDGQLHFVRRLNP